MVSTPARAGDNHLRQLAGSTEVKIQYAQHKSAVQINILTEFLIDLCSKGKISFPNTWLWREFCLYYRLSYRDFHEKPKLLCAYQAYMNRSNGY